MRGVADLRARRAGERERVRDPPAEAPAWARRAGATESAGLQLVAHMAAMQNSRRASSARDATCCRSHPQHRPSGAGCSADVHAQLLVRRTVHRAARALAAREPVGGVAPASSASAAGAVRLVALRHARSRSAPAGIRRTGTTALSSPPPTQGSRRCARRARRRRAARFIAHRDQTASATRARVASSSPCTLAGAADVCVIESPSNGAMSR